MFMLFPPNTDELVLPNIQSGTSGTTVVCCKRHAVTKVLHSPLQGSSEPEQQCPSTRLPFPL